MHDQLYAVIDVETTGNGVLGNKITEICIVLLQGNKTIDKYTTFVNPEQPIPAFITELTGINDSMVSNAPKFYEIAHKIEELTSGAIFVAHNVAFDYNVIRNEFKEIGKTYTRKKLCTVKLSKKTTPGLASYSLGKLCKSLDIPLNGRHRAEGDTDATVILLKHIFNLDANFSVINTFLKTKENTPLNLPAYINRELIEALPEKTGVYFLKNEADKIIYVSKAKNIKKSVISHFQETKNKNEILIEQIRNVDFELTGTELIASLNEVAYFKTLNPEFNTPLKKPVFPFQIIQYINRKGVIQLGIDRLKTTEHTFNLFYSKVTALKKLEELSVKNQLCPRYCNLESTTENCSGYKTKSCKGICQDEESIALYNIRVQQALNSITKEKETFIIKGIGRTDDEFSFVLVNEGVYKGLGYISMDIPINGLDDFYNYLEPKEHSFYTNKILQNYAKKSGKNFMFYLEQMNSVTL